MGRNVSMICVLIKMKRDFFHFSNAFCNNSLRNLSNQLFPLNSPLLRATAASATTTTTTTTTSSITTTTTALFYRYCSNYLNLLLILFLDDVTHVVDVGFVKEMRCVPF